MLPAIPSASAPETVEKADNHFEGQLSPVEAQRAVAILEDTVSKLSFLGSITPDVLQHRDELSKFVGDEISRIIHEQRRLEARYEELIAQRSALKGLANKSKYKEVQNEIQDVSRALRESTKHLCRNLKENPNISGNLIKIQRERTELIEIITHTIRELQENGAYHTLSNKVREDRYMQDEMRDIIDREKNMSDAVRTLDKSLTAEKRDHLQRVSEQKEQISALKEQLQLVKSRTTVDASYFKKEARAMTSSVLRGYRQAERAQEAKIRETERKLETEAVVHKQTVEFLLRKQKNLQDELDKWNTKYDQDYGALKAKYDALKEQQLKNRERLDHLQGRKRAEEEQAEEERQMVQRQMELERLQRKEDDEQFHAAQIVRRVTMAYLKRRAERGAGKKGKGKKGKGKKGKKGK